MNIFNTIEHFLEKFGVKNLSFITSVIFIFGIVFLVSPSYKSTSLISVQDQDISTNFNNSLFGSLISDSPESLYQLKSFLESNDASSQFYDLVDVDEFYMSKDVRLFSRYGTIFKKRFHDYFLDITSIKIIDDSQAIEIETFGFSSNHALKANIALIYISSEFFDKRERLSATIALAKKRCELAISKSEDINEVYIDQDFDKEINIDEFISANDLIYSKSSAFYNKCLNYTLVEDSISPQLPTSTLTDVNSSSSKMLVSEIFDSKMDSLSITDNLRIIAEPKLAINPERKRVLLKTFLFFVSIFLVFLMIKVLIKMRDNFIY